MSKDPTVEQYLAKLHPDLQTITRELVAVARKKMPKVHEFIYHDAVGYSVNASPFDRICHIAPQKGYVNFGFFFWCEPARPRTHIDWRGSKNAACKSQERGGCEEPRAGKIDCRDMEGSA